MTKSIFNNMKKQLEKAFNKINITESEKEFLSKPKETLEINFPVKLDNGETKTFTAPLPQKLEEVLKLIPKI